MGNDEIMNEGMETVVEKIVADKNAGLGTGATVALVLLGTIAVGGVIKLGTTLWANHKAKKAQSQNEQNVSDESEEDVEAE